MGVWHYAITIFLTLIQHCETPAREALLKVTSAWAEAAKTFPYEVPELVVRVAVPTPKLLSTFTINPLVAGALKYICAVRGPPDAVLVEVTRYQYSTSTKFEVIVTVTTGGLALANTRPIRPLSESLYIAELYATLERPSAVFAVPATPEVSAVTAAAAPVLFPRTVNVAMFARSAISTDPAGNATVPATESVAPLGTESVAPEEIVTVWPLGTVIPALALYRPLVLNVPVTAAPVVVTESLVVPSTDMSAVVDPVVLPGSAAIKTDPVELLALICTYSAVVLVVSFNRMIGVAPSICSWSNGA